MARRCSSRCTPMRCPTTRCAAPASTRWRTPRRTRRPPRWRSARTAPTGSPAPAWHDAPPEVARILASLVRQETRVGSGRLARSMVGSLDQDLPMLPNPERHAGFVVLKAADIPSVLVEMGFMSNPADEAELRRPQHRVRVAEAMKRAVDAYFARRRRACADGRSRGMDVWLAFSLLVGRTEMAHIARAMSEPLTAGEPLVPPPDGRQPAAPARRNRRSRAQAAARAAPPLRARRGGRRCSAIVPAGRRGRRRRRLFRLAALQRRPAGRRRAAQLPAAGDEPGLRRRRAAAGRTGHRAPHLRAVFGDPRHGEAGLRLGRGPEFLEPSTASIRWRSRAPRCST